MEMRPLWNRRTGEIFGESALFAGCDEVALRFPVRQIRRVRCSMTGMEFREGTDYLFSPGDGILTRLPGSAIPRLSFAELHPTGRNCVYFSPGTARTATAVGGGVNGENLRFDAFDFFGRHQIEVDYTAEAVDPPPRGGNPEEFYAGIAHRKTLRISWLGDSISEGYNASGFLGRTPFQPPFAELVREALEERLRIPVELRNHARDGAGSRDPLVHPDLWRDDRPGLLVIAFGMNDFATLTTEEYLGNLAAILRLNREVSPDSYCLLVAGMSGNPAWTRTPPETAAAFASGVRRLAEASGPRVGFADLHAWWRYFLKRKKFLDLTGNGVNHPNDFGHRILACGTLAALLPENEFL